MLSGLELIGSRFLASSAVLKVTLAVLTFTGGAHSGEASVQGLGKYLKLWTKWKASHPRPFVDV